MDIVLIGSGNVAHVLGQKALNAGHRIRQVVSPRVEHARELAALLNAEAGTPQELHKGSFLYILAIPDSALSVLGSHLKLGRSVVVHTSGATSREVLKDVSSNYGVLWPLQSLRKESASIPEFPLIIDANSVETLTVLEDFALGLSTTVCVAADEARRKLHLAAVVSGNFSNHLFALVNEYCRRESLDFRLLLPMLKETVQRMETADPGSFQTGPAVRNDLETIQAHLRILADDPEMQTIYQMMTQSIRNKIKGT